MNTLTQWIEQTELRDGPHCPHGSDGPNGPAGQGRQDGQDGQEDYTKRIRETRCIRLTRVSAFCTVSIGYKALIADPGKHHTLAPNNAAEGNVGADLQLKMPHFPILWTVTYMCWVCHLRTFEIQAHCLALAQKKMICRMAVLIV